MEEFIAKASRDRVKALEEAILKVGLAGGGKVVEPFLNQHGTFISIVAGEKEPPLPETRVEYLVPRFYEENGS